MSDPNATLTDLEMMLAPERWPNWIADLKLGVLPLKHYDAPHPAGQGLLYARTDSQDQIEWTWAWKENLWDRSQAVSRDHTVFGGQELIRLLVQCGWVVD